MKTARFLASLALAATAGICAPATQAEPQQEDNAMAMSMGMMAGPIHQAVMTAFVLPEMQADLGLSAQQVMQLRDLKQEMLSKGKEFAGRGAARQKELDAMLTAGTSKGEVVKKLLEQIADLRAQQLYTGYETAARMKILLSEAQRAKLAAMKPHEFHQAAMSHLTTLDMMQMMQFMGGEGMMLGRMMMGQGMFGQGMMGPGMMRHEGMPAAPPKQ